MSKLSLASLLILLIPPLSASAQEQGSQPPKEAATNPDSTEPFRRQLEPLLRAYSSGDEAKKAEAIKTFSLPSPEDWFTQNFGAENTRQLVEGYGKALEAFRQRMSKLFDPQKASKIELVSVTRFSNHQPAVNPASAMPAPLKQIITETFQIKILNKDSTFSSWTMTLVRLDNSYNFVGLGDAAFWARSHRRITVGGNVEGANLTHQVPPVYPESAKKDHLSGTVRLHAIIDTEGKITQLEIVSGPPPLVEAALDAVRQWRYRPTLINGVPVEVETFIEVVFTLSK